ncbi:MAG: HupE/UreJ family protein [Acidobacteriota bacterium]|nr:HupE/UreJ family protein [Acidobacteriota bacterium]
MKLALCPALVYLSTPALCAHMMSMSTGDAVVSGNHVEYVLRMPSYEMPRISDPARALFDHIRFSSGGRPAKLLNEACHEDAPRGEYVCAAYYEFPSAVERLDVECALYEVTVPNHVHLLRAEKAGKRDQAIFDYSFSRGRIRFEPPGAIEIAATQMGSGMMCALSGLAQILFLAGLAIASRSRRELMAMTAMFLAGQIASALLLPVTGWHPPARFVEAAAALTVAYLAVEILFLPAAGMRWPIAGVLGAFHGLYFALWIANTGFRPAYVLSGAAGAEILTIALLATVFAFIERRAAILRPATVAASAMLAAGLIWFFLRLRG